MNRAVQERENSFYQKHFTEIAQVKTEEHLLYLFDLAKKLAQMYNAGDPVLGKLLSTFTGALQFYEKSSRTFGSFLSAMLALGMHVVGIHDMGSFSSAAKGEKLTDGAVTARSSWKAHVIALRHPENDSSTRVAAELDKYVDENGLKTLLINAGAGSWEHPTQALLDAYTIFNKLGRLHDLHIVMVGDMLYGRTVKSLARLLGTVGKNIRITFVAPEALAMPADVITELQALNVVVDQATSFDNLSTANVFYWTRVQKERILDQDIYEAVKDQYILTPELAATFSRDAIFMHPLPRVNEIEEEMDDDDRSVYLTKQMEAGQEVRMALLLAMLEENPHALIKRLADEELAMRSLIEKELKKTKKETEGKKKKGKKSKKKKK